MCAINNKKRPVSRFTSYLKGVLFVSLAMAFVVQNCCPSIATDKDESRPLLSGGNPNGRSHPLREVVINGDQNGGSQYVFDLIEATSIDETLLTKVDRDRAKSQLGFIIDFVSLSKNPIFLKTLQKKHAEEAQKSSISINTIDELSRYLVEKAWWSINDKPTLANYLNDRREHSEKLIDLMEKILQERKLLRGQIGEQNDAIRQLQELLQAERAKQGTELLGGDLFQGQVTVVQPQGGGRILRYIVPAATFVAGGVTFGLLGYYGILGHGN
jgi:hypothetical protein